MEEIETIAIDTDITLVKYIQTPDGKIYKIIDNTTSTETDGYAPGKNFLVSAPSQSPATKTQTNGQVYYINNDDLGRTILHSEALALGDEAADGTYPIEINCRSNNANGISTKGSITSDGNITSTNTVRGSKVIARNPTSGSTNIYGGFIQSTNNNGVQILINNNPGEISCSNILLNSNIHISDSSASNNYIGNNTQIGTHIRIDKSGTITASAFYQESDERLKTFTEDYNINLDDIKNIKTGRFYWNSDENQVINGGVTAQSVEKYFPELVREDENGTKTVNYDGLAGVAIAAIKKLTERIEELENIVYNK